MNYNKRCIIVIPKTGGNDYLEEEDAIAGYDEIIKACGVSNLSNEEQMSVFGKYNQDAFKLHIQGRIERPFEVKFESNVKRQVHSVRYHRNTTVVIVT